MELLNTGSEASIFVISDERLLRVTEYQQRKFEIESENFVKIYNEYSQVANPLLILPVFDKYLYCEDKTWYRDPIEVFLLYLRSNNSEVRSIREIMESESYSDVINIDHVVRTKEKITFNLTFFEGEKYKD